MKKKKKELEMLDDPKIQSVGSSLGLLKEYLLADYIADVLMRKERVVNLRIKMRMSELSLDPNKDYQKYYEIRNEEEKRFDERFKDYNKK